MTHFKQVLNITRYTKRHCQILLNQLLSKIDVVPLVEIRADYKFTTETVIFNNRVDGIFVQCVYDLATTWKIGM